jgi:predicted AAA+ superfamily ATPase
MRQVSESLAGRLSLVELTTFLQPEVSEVPIEDLWLRGGFPEGGVLDPPRYPHWQRDFLELLASRDLPTWGLSAKPQLILRFMRMLAATHGNLWNASQIGQSMGLSYHTVNNYLEYFEGAFLIRKLDPFHANLKKRLVRSPKCYWRDTGLLHSLHGVSDYEHLLSQPWAGASWEGFVIEQALGILTASGRTVNANFFRTSDGHEIDLLFRHERVLWAVEIKLTSSPSEEHFARLEKAADMVGAKNRVLISHTRETVREKNRFSCSLPGFLATLSA